jgi:hypothetical protein
MCHARRAPAPLVWTKGYPGRSEAARVIPATITGDYSVTIEHSDLAELFVCVEIALPP